MIAQAPHGASLLGQAAHVDPATLSAVQVRRLSREVRRAPGTADARIAFGGNVVFEPLPEFVEAYLACHGIRAATHVAAFGQVLQELADSTSGIRQFNPDFLFLHFETTGMMPRVPSGAEGEGIAEIFALLEPAVRVALETTTAIVLLTNFVGPDCYQLGIADARAELGEQELFARLNSRLARTFRDEPRVQIVDLCRLMAWHGRSRARDRRLYYMAKIPWHESFLPVLADELSRHVGAALGRIRKCLVVDLDNTLWAGVLGEEGPQGIRVGSGDPIAEAHFDLQQRIRGLMKRGILLALCSKNNPAEVEDVFQARRDMPLQRQDFACVQVGWGRKDEGLRRIAAALNIGTDSLVFLDDNPAEIELIRSVMPEVECVLVPADPALRPTCLDRVHGLDRAVVTAEDLSKTRQYHENAARASTRNAFGNVNDYLRNLRMRVEIRDVSGGMLPRVHQLFTKTNQFNLTTHRYSFGELERLASDASCALLAVRAADRFGELGWIGAILLCDLDEPEASIDSLLLSCRAMGRGIETALLNHAKTLCFERQRCEALIARYVPTARNTPVRELYEGQGFELTRVQSDGTKLYRLQRRDNTPGACDWLEVLDEKAPS